MKKLTAVRHGRPVTWGRCFTVARGPGRYFVGARVRATIVEEDGVVWHGIAECFWSAPARNGRAVCYDFAKVREGVWMKRGVCPCCGADFIRTWRNNRYCPECGRARRRESHRAAERRLYAKKRSAVKAAREAAP